MAFTGRPFVIIIYLMNDIYKDIYEDKIQELDLDTEFRFSCLKCAMCCTNGQDVYLTPYDIYRWRKCYNLLTLNLIRNKVIEVVIDENSMLPVCKIKFVHVRETNSMICPFLRSIYFNDKDVGRNGLCPCGSGKKYKKCCEEKNGTFYCECWENRPTLCRLYPLGSIIKWDKDSKEYKTSFYFVGDLCKGMFGRAYKVKDAVEDEEIKKSLQYGMEYTLLLKKLSDNGFVKGKTNDKYIQVITDALYDYDALITVDRNMEFDDIWKEITSYFDRFLNKPEDFI